MLHRIIKLPVYDPINVLYLIDSALQPLPGASGKLEWLRGKNELQAPIFRLGATNYLLKSKKDKRKKHVGKKVFGLHLFVEYHSEHM